MTKMSAFVVSAPRLFGAIPLTQGSPHSLTRRKTHYNCKASMSVITFVTGNQNKLRETNRILAAAWQNGTGEIPFTLIAQKIDLPEMQGTPEEIAIEKCRAAAALVSGPVVR